MNYIAYFKRKAKDLFKDYQTKTPYWDEAIGRYLYEYKPQCFDIDRIILKYDINEENFSLMKAQHIIALMTGFRKWAALLKASEFELELAKLLIDNPDKVMVEDWEMYIYGVECDNNIQLDAESKLAIFKQLYFVAGSTRAL